MDTVLSTPERDPRVDWRAGDVMEKRGWTRRIFIVSPDGVDYTLFNGGVRHGARFAWNEDFRKWASNAQVVRKGEE